jgi:peptidoglycan DL-endopeptidase CwlO
VILAPWAPLRRPALRRPLVVLLATALALGSVTAADAQPTSREVRGDLQQARERLDELDEQRGRALERFNTAQVELDAVSEQLETTRAHLAALRDDHADLALAVEDHIRRLHKLGPAVELSTVLISGDPSDAGLRSSTLRRILEEQSTDLEALEASRTNLAAGEQRLAEEQELAAQRAAELEEEREALEASFATTEAEISELRELLEERLAAEEEARRREEERLRRQAERERQAERARQREAEQQAARTASRSSSSPSTTSTSSGGSAAPQPAPTARASADVAVRTALAQLGKPYQWGGSGPNSFDCSGLTSYAWRAAGVTLPRTSGAQYAGTRRISRAELQPGDLVFYHSPISHVAMYIGNGQVVEAPNSGNNVRIRSDGLTRRGIVGFGRP